MQLKFFILIFVSIAVIFAGASPKLSDVKKEEIAKNFIAQITDSFGTRTNNKTEAAVKEYINTLDNSKKIEVKYDRPYKLNVVLQTVVRKAYRKGRSFWAEAWGHYLSRRVYQEILAIRNANQEKLQLQFQQLQQQIVSIAGAWPKLTDLKKQQIANNFIAEITYAFGTKTNNRVEAAVKEYINTVDSLIKISDRPVKLNEALQTIVTNAYNKGKEFWAEACGHKLSRIVYYEILAIRNANQGKINELQRQFQQLQKQIQEL